MPAAGRGAHATPGYTAVGTKIKPPKPPPAPPGAPLRGGLAPARPVPRAAPLPAQPFHAAQQHAAQAVAHARAALPPQRAPHIPLLANPTPAQAHAALQVALAAQQRAVGASPTAARIREYQSELASDPRLRQFREAIQHYTRAAEGHVAGLEGRRELTGAPTLSQAPQAVTGASRAAEKAIGAALIAARGPGATARPLPKPKDWSLPLLGVAHVTVPGTAALGATIGHALSSVAPGLAGATPEAQFARNLLGDVKTVGELPFVGGYKVAEGAVQAAKGNTQPITALAKGTLEGLRHGFAADVLKGDFHGAEEAFRRNPLISLAEVTAVGGVAGRSAGALARGVGSSAAEDSVRGALARAGSTVRPPLALADEAGLAKPGSVRERAYSKDLIRKTAQVIADRRRTPVLDAQGRPVTVAQRGRTVPVLRASAREQEKLQQRRANLESARAVSGEQRERQLAAHARTEAEATPNRLPATVSAHLTPLLRGRARAVRVPGVGPIRVSTLAHHLTQLVATGTIRSGDLLKSDLLKRAAHIEEQVAHPERFRHAGTKRDPGELRVAKRNAAILRAAADSPRVLAQAKQIVAQGLAHAGQLNRSDVGLEHAGINPHLELERSKLSEYALAHMDATHFTVADHAAAEAAAATPAEKFAVSGRNPRRTLEHLAARADHVAAEKARKSSAVKIQNLDRRLARKKGAARRSQGSGENRRPMRRQDAREIHQLETQLKGARADHKATVKTKREAMQRLRENPLPPRQAGLRHPDGRFLSNDEIRTHAQAHGRNPDTLAYLPHVLGTGDPRSFHRQFRPGGRPAPEGQRRTGSLFQRGANAVSHDLVQEELTAKGTTLAKARALDRLVSEGGLRHPAVQKAREGGELTAQEQRIVDKGGYMTAQEARDLSERLNKDGNGEWVPVTAFSSKLSAGVQSALRDAQSPAAMETAHAGLLSERIVGADYNGRARNVVLLPAHQVTQLERQLRPAGEVEKAIQLLNGPFRMAVLPQPRWLTGNFLEPFFVRLPLSGSGANLPGLALDLRAAKRALSSMEKSADPGVRAAAEEIRAHQFQGLFIGRRNATIYRTYRDFSGNTQRALYGAHVLRNLPAVKQLGDLVLSIPHGFFAFNRVLEANLQRAAFGKAVRHDVQEFTGKWTDTIALGRQAVDEATRGLVNTPTQHRFLEYQHELLGQYDTFSPTLRRAVQGAFPFLPWTLASLRFVFWTLPAHHTVAFTGLVKAAQSVLPEWEAQHNAILSPSAKEGTLADAAIRSDKGLVDVARYTPFGATIPVVRGDLTSLLGTAFPQLSGATEALRGRDPFGRELQVPRTPSNPKGQASLGQKLEVAGNSALESLVPLLAQARRLREGGATPYSTSTIVSPQTKPESSHQSAVNRTLNPFRPTYLKAPSSGSVPEDPRVRAAIKVAEEEERNPRTQAGLAAAIEQAEREGR